jgi:hypothetical protein
LCGHTSKYYQGPTLLDFGDQMGIDWYVKRVRVLFLSYTFPWCVLSAVAAAAAAAAFLPFLPVFLL